MLSSNKEAKSCQKKKRNKSPILATKHILDVQVIIVSGKYVHG